MDGIGLFQADFTGSKENTCRLQPAPRFMAGSNVIFQSLIVMYNRK